MLKGISGILSSKLLKILMEMGHGDELLLADGNYPKLGHPAVVATSESALYANIILVKGVVK